MSDRSIEVYKQLQEASDKFDYFVCAVSGGLFAYISQTYSPTKLQINAPTLESLSLLFLALSFYFGLKRIDYVSKKMLANYEQLHASTAAGQMTSTLDEPVTSSRLYNPESGETMSRPQAEERRKQRMGEAKEWGKELEAVSWWTWFFSKIRDLFLMLGFGAILASKIWQAYGGDGTIQKASSGTATNLQTINVQTVNVQGLNLYSTNAQPTNIAAKPVRP